MYPADWFNSLPEEQQTWLLETAEEAGEYNNEVQQAADAEYLQKMKDEGVTVVERLRKFLPDSRRKHSRSMRWVLTLAGAMAL